MASLDRERWNAVSSYLDQALEMESEELAVWLGSLRSEKPALAADLEILLGDRAAIAREGFLEGDGAAPPPDDTPRTVGPYRLIRKIGEGGMGIVYLAEQTAPLRREVALKVIRPGLDSAKVLARFAVERQILANLNHAGISKVYDAGVASDGRPYVAMEYVSGVSLTRFCDENRLSVGERLELFLQVCAAIQHAHQKGVIHRDVKPSNLLASVVDGKPLVKVIDFGIAKALQPSREEMLLTLTGTTLGTPEYMSPEQASPDSDDVDTRTDVYALGVVLYELLAGVRPFEARDLARPTPLALLETIRDKDPPKLTSRLHAASATALEIAALRRTDVRRLARQLGGELEWITMRALEKQPSRRYASAAELGADIERHLRAEPVLAGPPSTLYRLRKLARRHRVAATAIAAVALAITLGAVVSTLALLRAVRSERLGRQQLRASLVNQAVTLTNSGEVDRRDRALEALKAAAEIQPGLDARNAALAALAAPGFHLVQEWEPTAAEISVVESGSAGSARESGGWPTGGLRRAWPDTRLERYARCSDAGPVTIHRIGDDAEIYRLPRAAVCEFGRFSPDGHWVALVPHDRSVRLWRLPGGTAQDATTAAPSAAQGKALPMEDGRLVLERDYSLRFTTDSSRLVASSKDRVHVLDVTSDAAVDAAQAGTVSDVAPVLHPREPLFFVPSYGADGLEIRRLSDGAVARTVNMPSLGMTGIWTPDASSLVTAHLDYALRVWDWPAMGAPRLVLRFHKAEPVHLATDPSGRWLATAGWDNQIGIFDLSDGRLLLNTRGNYVYSASDRPAFVFINGTKWRLITLEPPFARETLMVPELYKGPWDVAWSPDGRWLATAGPSGVQLMDHRSGRAQSLVDDEYGLRVAFHPGGELRAITKTHLLAWRLTQDPATGAPVAERCELIGSRKLASALAGEFSRDAEQWVTLEKSPKSGRYVWYHGRFDDSSTPEESEALAIADRGPALSSDGRWLAWGNWRGHQAAVKPVGVPGPVVTFPAERSASVAFTPDGRRLALCTSEDLRFYEVGTWRQLAVWRRPASPLKCSVAFTSDSRLCAVSLPLERVLLLDTFTGEELGSIPAAPHALSRLAFSPDDRTIAVASTDHHVFIWDIRKLRNRLSELGLDWHSGAGPPASGRTVGSAP